MPVSRNLRPDVDQFLATLPGEPALELPLDKSVKNFKGVYTACFLGAFQHPDEPMVRTLNGVRVVPNRSLKEQDYLLREVHKMAAANSARLDQIPVAIVESPYTAYIGRAAALAPEELSLDSGIRRLTPWVGPTILDVAGRELEHAGAGALISASKAPNGSEARTGPRHWHTRVQLSVETGGPIPGPGQFIEVTPSGPIPGPGEYPDIFAAALDTILRAQARGPGVGEILTGFTVFGARVQLAAINPRFRADFSDARHGPDGEPQAPAVVQVELGAAPAGSVALQFSDGSGTVIAALAGYIGTIVVDGGAVVNVSYNPSPNNWRWSVGAFRIEGERDVRAKRGEQFFDSIRMQACGMRLIKLSPAH